jgi:Staphylococcal nuclease homologue
MKKTDRYGRLLAYVCKDEAMFNETLLEEGYAQVATPPPNVKYVDRFLAAQEEARNAGKGLWVLSAEELAAETDRGNRIGGDECTQEATQPAPKQKAKTTPSTTKSSSSDDWTALTSALRSKRSRFSTPIRATPTTSTKIPTGRHVRPYLKKRRNLSTRRHDLYPTHAAARASCPTPAVSAHCQQRRLRRPFDLRRFQQRGSG